MPHLPSLIKKNTNLPNLSSVIKDFNQKLVRDTIYQTQMGIWRYPGEQISSPAKNITWKELCHGSLQLFLQQHGFWIFNIAFECF